jgi:mannose-6-phosphate isomerase-like protein (cupin superfamily)
MTSASGRALQAQEGNAYWFVGTLMTVKADSESTGGAFTLIEQVAPPGFGPPPHVHHVDEEAFYVLDGEITVTCGDDTWTIGPGGSVFLPKGVPHSFTVWQQSPVRLLQFSWPAQFERFVAELGEPARELTLPPEAGPPDIERIIAVAAKYGTEIVGPPAH